MKKFIAILFTSLMLASIAACSAADNSTITSPRMDDTEDTTVRIIIE